MSVSVGSRSYVHNACQNQHSDSHYRTYWWAGHVNGEVPWLWHLLAIWPLLPFFCYYGRESLHMPGLWYWWVATTLVGPDAWSRASGFDLAYMTVGLGMAVMAVMGVVMYVFAPRDDWRSFSGESIREIEHLFAHRGFRWTHSLQPASWPIVFCVGAGDTENRRWSILGSHVAGAPHSRLMLFPELWLGGYG